MELFLILMSTFMMLIIITIYNVVMFIRNILYKIKINNLLESVERREDLLYMRYKDFVNVIILAFRRKGMEVKATDKCGEEENGLILNKRLFAELWKHSLNDLVEVETARKLARCMQLNSIYRGMIITIGDFKQNTRLFCHTNVIQCINGEQLVGMCKEVQRRRVVLEDYTTMGKT